MIPNDLPSRRRFFRTAGGALMTFSAGGLRGAAPGTTTTPTQEKDKDQPEGWTSPAQAATFAPVVIPKWVDSISRMAFLSPGEVERAARAGVQVVHGNAVWPYYPLRRDGGGLSHEDAATLKKFVADCHARGMKLCLGLPPFPPVELVKKHPDWRVHPDRSGSVLSLAPGQANLGTRVGCNLGPWGDYLIDVCVELIEDFGVDGYSFDGNYHPRVCYCPACTAAFRRDLKRELPGKVDLDDVAYREYLVWRGERLEDHYRRMQERIKRANRDAVLMSWTVNAGRYGHILDSPRWMPTRLNLLFDLPMQEWWLDETNFGASVVPAFGAAYLRATTGGRPAACEPYLMSRGNPYGSDSFPEHERHVRTMLALTQGCLAPQSFGFLGAGRSTEQALADIRRREPWLLTSANIPWAALLVSEQTRQFYAYKDIAGRYLPHLLGAFRVALEEHLALTLINDWDVNQAELERYRVLILAGAAALSGEQAAAVREFVHAGGGLVATAETSLCDALGRPRRDFALADLFGVSYRGRVQQAATRPALDPNFAVAIDENYWKDRSGTATLAWTDHPLTRDERLDRLVPARSAVVRAPLVAVSEPSQPGDVVARMTPEGSATSLPAVIVRAVGKGRVVHLAAALDAAMWSYAYPYQRRLLARVIEYAAGKPFPIQVRAPMCVQATFFAQQTAAGRRTIVHLFNGANTTAHHGLPAVDVPLREESLPVHGIEVRFSGAAPRRFSAQPGDLPVDVRRRGATTIVRLPPLETHLMLIGEA